MNAGLMQVSLLASVLWATFVALFCTDSGIGMLWFLLLFYGGAGLLALWVLRALVFVAWGRKRGRPAPWPRRLLEPVVVGLVAAAIMTGFAFRVRFVIAGPSATGTCAQCSRVVSSPTVASGRSWWGSLSSAKPRRCRTASSG